MVGLLIIHSLMCVFFFCHFYKKEQLEYSYTSTGFRMALIFPKDALQMRSRNTVSAT